MKILIVEDDLVSRSFLDKFLGKYGECDLVVDGLEAVDAFLLALKEKDPYDLICLDIMMPKVDGVNTLKAIRDLERQYGIASENRVKIVMTTALSEAQFVHKAFDYGCEAYAVKPIDTKKFMEVLEKLGLIKNTSNINLVNESHQKSNFNDINENIPNQDVIKNRVQSDIKYDTNIVGDGYFRNVRALPDYQLEVEMETGTTIYFDFHSRLNTARFGSLQDRELFNSVRTDGNYLLFDKAGKMPVKITASEFIDLVLVDRRK